MKEGLTTEGRFTFVFISSLFTNPVNLRCILNSILLASVSTALTLVIALPLSFLMLYRFRGREFLSSALLVPMVMPPFVGTIGMRKLLGRFGSFNLLLMKAGLIDSPIDSLGTYRF